MQHEAAIHAEIERNLKRLDGVVAAVRIAAVICLTHAGDDVLDATAVGERASKGGLCMPVCRKTLS